MTPGPCKKAIYGWRLTISKKTKVIKAAPNHTDITSDAEILTFYQTDQIDIFIWFPYTKVSSSQYRRQKKYSCRGSVKKTVAC